MAIQFMKEFWDRLPGATQPPPLSRRRCGSSCSTAGRATSASCATSWSAWWSWPVAAADAVAELEPDPIEPVQDGVEVDLDLPYKEAKMRWVDKFEMTYVSEILRRNKGNVAGAARQAGVDRTYLFRLIRKYGLKK